MTNLKKTEIEIINSAKRAIAKYSDDDKRKIRNIKFKDRYLEIPFTYYFDKIVYDTILKKFVKIKYHVGFGLALHFAKIDSVADFDKFKTLEIDISDNSDFEF